MNVREFWVDSLKACEEGEITLIIPFTVLTTTQDINGSVSALGPMALAVHTPRAFFTKPKEPLLTDLKN